MSLLPVLPMGVLVLGLALAMIGIAVRRSHAATFGITLAAIIGSGAAAAGLASSVPMQGGPLFFADGFALFYAGLVLIAGACVAILARDYLKGRAVRPEEFYMLLLGALTGALALIFSCHFASFFLGLEVLSVSLYCLIAYPRSEARQTEGAIKYLVLSGASSAILLYGMAIVYGLTGAMGFPAVFQALANLKDGQAAVFAGTAFIVTGVGFKLGVVPFHMWTPDVYEGAPAPVTAFIATASKGAVFADRHAIFLRRRSLRGARVCSLQHRRGRVDARREPPRAFPDKHKAAPRLLVDCPFRLPAGCVPLCGPVQNNGSHVLPGRLFRDNAGRIQRDDRTVGARQGRGQVGGLRRPFLHPPVAGRRVCVPVAVACRDAADCGVHCKDIHSGRRGRFRVAAASVAALIAGSGISLFYYLRVIAALFRKPGSSPRTRRPAAWARGS